MTSSGVNEVVNAEDICKSFGALEVLHKISLSAGRNEVVSILGRSGSGKSTFLRCINLLETPESGTVSINGQTIDFESGKAVGHGSAMSQRYLALRRKTAMVFQQFNLWPHWTVLENVSNVPIHVHGVARKEALERAEVLLERTGMTDKRNAYPAQLSGGQQQRVAIARALAVEPDVLLFDEPTSALDPELVNEVLLVIRKLATEGQTMLIVTHEINFAREVSDRVVFFDAGQIAESGSAKDILSGPSSAAFRKFLQLPA